MGREFERIVLGLHRAAGTLVHALGALRDDPGGARPRRGCQQVVGSPGPEFVGGGEHLVNLAEAPHVRQRGHLMHDHLRRGGPHRRDHRLTIQPIDDRRLRARLSQLSDLARSLRGSGDLVTRREQHRHEVPSQCPGRSRDENSPSTSMWPAEKIDIPQRRQGNQQREEQCSGAAGLMVAAAADCACLGGLCAHPATINAITVAPDAMRKPTACDGASRKRRESC